MPYEWQRNNGMPDFTRSGNDTGGGSGRLVWLLVVLAVLGGFVLFNAFSNATPPAATPDAAQSEPATAPVPASPAE